MYSDEIEKLYTLYYKEVFLYALSLCRVVEQAEILTSDTFFKALLSSKEIDINIKYWLFRVCKNSFIDQKRREKYVTETEPINLSDTVLEKVLEHEQQRRLYGAITRLQSPYKDGILLHYFYGYSLKEVGEILHIKSGAVRTIVFRARIKLKELLQ